MKELLEIFKKTVSLRWNQVMFVILILLCISGFIDSLYAGVGFVFLSICFFIHKCILVSKDMQIDKLSSPSQKAKDEE